MADEFSDKRAEQEQQGAEQPVEGEQPGTEQPDAGGDAGAAEPNPAYELEKALQEAEGERDKLFDRLQRVSADYQNYIKRAEQQLGREIDRTRGDLLRGFIPVLDNFDKALGAEPAGEEARSLFEGMRMVRDELLKVLNQAGVERLDVEVGEPFDPHRHEALMQQEVEGVEPGCVAATMQPGYVYGERTLRPAKVAVTPSA